MAADLSQPVGRGVSSTGRRPVNLPDDVMVVQQLLNRVTPDQGGPRSPLVENGTVDQPTYLAICRFQEQQFHWADGVVDPDNKTLHRLNDLASESPFPHFLIDWLVPDTDPEAPDAATAYRALRAAEVAKGFGDNMIFPRQGFLRNTICETARKQATGGHFEPKYWSVVSPASPAPSPVRTQWCGIYDVWVWVQAQLQAEWCMVAKNQGADNGPYKLNSTKRIQTSSDKAFIAPGDIVVQAYGAIHHLLVLSIKADGTQAEVLEGNAGAGDAAHTVVRTRSAYDLSNVGYFYSVDSYRWPDGNYGNNIPGSK
jgi:hypothetical protein